MRNVLLVFALLWSWSALAASPTVQQSGNVTPGHVGQWTTNGVLQDGGPATNGSVTNLGLLGSGLPFCINDAPVSSPSGYHQFCLGANVSSQGLLSYQAYGGATPQALTVNVNGVAYPLAFPGGTGLPQVVSNTALKALTVGLVPVVYRSGFTTAGDGGAAYYVYSSSACSISSGAGDNGSQVQPNSGGGCWLLSPQDGGADVRVWGAKGDGVTDDTAAIQATVNSLPSGGKVVLALGTYCIKTGPISTSTSGVTIEGQNRQTATILSACGADVGIVSFTGTHDILHDVAVYGSTVLATTHPSVYLGSGCAECTLDDVIVLYGNYNVQSVGASFGQGEIYLRNSKFQWSSKGGIFLQNSGGYIERDKLDQPWPGGTPSRFVNKPAWLATTTYAAGALATTGGYVIQSTVGGTSGSVAPTVLPFGQSIVDGAGSLRWQVVGPTTYYGIQCDTGCAGDLYIRHTDISAPYTAAIALTNSLSGQAPIAVNIDDVSVSFNQDFGILLSAGSVVQIVNSNIGSCVITGCNLVATNANFVGDLIESNNVFVGGATGTYLGAGASLIVSNNIFGALTTSVSVAAQQHDFTISGNMLGGSAQYGANATGVFLASDAATAATDYFSIIGNDTNQATTTINDSTKGTHKVIVDAVYNTTKFSQHLFSVSGTAPVIASGFGTAPSITGTDNAGRITVGGGGAAAGSVTFGTPFPVGANPACVANNETSLNLVRVVSSATTLTFGGTMAAADTISWVCLGFALH